MHYIDTLGVAYAGRVSAPIRQRYDNWRICSAHSGQHAAQSTLHIAQLLCRKLGQQREFQSCTGNRLVFVCGMQRSYGNSRSTGQRKRRSGVIHNIFCSSRTYNASFLSPGSVRIARLTQSMSRQISPSRVLLPYLQRKISVLCCSCSEPQRCSLPTA